MPTRAVCDAYDGVKRDAVALLSLHNAIQKKEKEISTLRGLNPTDIVHRGEKRKVNYRNFSISMKKRKFCFGIFNFSLFAS